MSILENYFENVVWEKTAAILSRFRMFEKFTYIRKLQHSTYTGVVYLPTTFEKIMPGISFQALIANSN